jgi:hypothetical protein
MLRANHPPGIFSEMKSVRFFRSIPAPTVTVHQKACNPKALFNMTLDNETIGKLKEDSTSYKFRICKKNEALSNVYKLEQHGKIEGNTITLKGGNGDEKGNQNRTFIPEDDSTYIIQIYQNVHKGETPPFDEISCATEVEVTIGTTPEPISIGYTLKEYTFKGTTYHISSKGASDGEATLTLSRGGLKMIEYSFNNGGWQSYQVKPSPSHRYTISSLKPGKYKFKAIDRDDCESSVIEFELKEPASVSIGTTTPGKVKCHINNAGEHSDGQIVTNFSGGIGPYKAYLYKDGGTNPTKTATGINAFKYQFEDLATGTYSVKIVDRFGAEKTKTGVPVTSNPEVQISAVPIPNKCYGYANGSIQLTVTNKTTNNVTFTLTGETDLYTGENTVNYPQLSAGNYTATVTNTNHCTATTPVSLIDPDEIEINTDVTVVAKYGDNTGSIDFTISGGTGEFNYIFSDDNGEISTGQTTEEINISNLYTGHYHISITDNNDCPQTLNNIHVRQPDAPLSLSFTQLNVDCFGNSTGEVYPIASGGWGLYKYGFNGLNYGSVTTIDGLPATGGSSRYCFCG